MRHTLTLAIIPAIACTLAAQSVGNVAGKITDKAGNPLSGATISMMLVGTTVTKEIKTDANGKYFQAGLAPREFEFTFKADGFVTQKKLGGVKMGDILRQDIIMLTPEQAQEENSKNNPLAKEENDATKAGNAGLAAFNSATPLLNSQNFTEALPLMNPITL